MQRIYRVTSVVDRHGTQEAHAWSGVVQMTTTVTVAVVEPRIVEYSRDTELTASYSSSTA